MLACWLSRRILAKVRVFFSSTRIRIQTIIRSSFRRQKKIRTSDLPFLIHRTGTNDSSVFTVDIRPPRTLRRRLNFYIETFFATVALLRFLLRHSYSMNKKEQTVHTYNTTAERMVQKFSKSGVRVNDIQETFALLSRENPFVIEIGCASGRDAKEIIKYTHHYIGLDIAEEFIRLAKEYVPEGTFVVADIESYSFPEDVDVIFAFASLIHVPKESLQDILERAHKALRSGGVMRISMKHADSYREVTKEDEFGIRTYYHYSLEDLLSLVSEFTVITHAKVEANGQWWIELLLQK